MDVLEPDQHRLIVIRFVIMRRLEKGRLGPGPALTRERTAQLGRGGSLTAAQSTEIGNNSVARAAGCSVGLNEHPVGVLLAALPSLAPLEEHDATGPPLEPMIASKKHIINR